MTEGAAMPNATGRHAADRVDTLSWMFSLVLSALIEQLGSREQWVGKQVTQLLEFLLVLFGLGVYLVFSLMMKHGSVSSYLQMRTAFHGFYVVLGTGCVCADFFLRSDRTRGVKA